MSHTIVRAVAFATALACASRVHAQSLVIQGTVVTRSTQPVTGARIALLNSAVIVTSDSTGRFSIPVPGRGVFRLSITKPGYSARSISVAAPQSGAVTIALTPLSQSLATTVVTAERREQTVLDAPVALTVLDAERLQATRAWELKDLQGLVPNFRWTDQGASYQAFTNVRGIAAFSDDPAIATYVDGVPAFDIAANGLPLADVERVEFLRGPQGTLYGRNALGGVINIVTKAPTNDRSGSIEVGTGNLGLRRINAQYRAPLVANRLFGSLSAQWQQAEGYYENRLAGSRVDGSRFGDNTSMYLNSALRWLPGGLWRIDLNAKAQLDDARDNTSYFAFAPSDTFARANPFELRRNRVGQSSRRLVNASLSALRSGNAMTFQSVSSVQRVGFGYDDIDFDGGPADVFWASTEQNNVIGARQPQTILNQEFRLSSGPGASTVRWTTGLYAFRQTRAVSAATNYEAAAAGFFPPALAAQLPFTTVQGGDLTNTGVAGFGEVTVTPLPRLELTAGVRFDRETREASVDDFRLKNGVRTYTVQDQARRGTFSAASPKASALFRPTESSQLYASYARGFRAGGVNLFTNNEQFRTYDPETSDNVELGAKGAWFDRRLTVNAALFQIDWRDQQLIFGLGAGEFITTNLGRVRSRGGELEATALVAPGLRVEQALGVTNARYRSLSFLGADRTGNRPYYTPAYTSNTAIELSRDLPGRSLWSDVPSFLLRAELQAFGAQYFDVLNTIRQPAYALVNLRGSIDVGRYRVSGWMSNATDRRYLSYASPTFFRFSVLGPPRTYGIGLTARY